MKYGYVTLTIQSYTTRPLLASNSERSFVISFLQHALSYRPYIPDELPFITNLSSYADLLAFSITRKHIKLVLFCSDTSILGQFATTIRNSLAWYQGEFSPQTRASTSRASITKLKGPHHALQETMQLHLCHEDWEYDRYSSIGFYLHDRRGDWMRLWRMAKLYEQLPEQYRRLIIARRVASKAALVATSLHG